MIANYFPKNLLSSNWTRGLVIVATITFGALFIHLVTPSASSASIYFAIGPGQSDVIPHQIVRAKDDRLYLFAGQQYTNLIRVFRTTNPGLPSSTTDFDPAIQLADTDEPISVDTAYDGNNIIHVLINNRSGQLKDYPFDITTDAFKSGIVLASNSGTVVGDYIGTSGVSGMVDKDGALQVVYWSNMNHILHGAFSYTSSTNTLTPISAFFQVDSAGNANHPVIAVSPLDNSQTIAWMYGAATTDQGKIAARFRASNGQWSAEQPVSTARAWTSPSSGINIDQGPSLIIDSSGMRHLTYIENWDQTGTYGRIHYVINGGSGWTDQSLVTYSNNPALALDSSGSRYIIAHGYPNDATCRSTNDLCTIKKNSTTWDAPQIFATHLDAVLSFDSSPSVKWSVVGFNRPETIEFVFFAAPYTSPTLYYGRLSSTPPTATGLQSFQARPELTQNAVLLTVGVVFLIGASSLVVTWLHRRLRG